MSKLTLSAAIKHCFEVAEEQSRLYSLCPCPCDGTDNCMSLKNGKDMGCTKCAADYRQLAEWLTELKEAKRLLRLAVDDMTREADCGICLHDNDNKCPIEVAACKFKWRYADEALKLIKED